MPTEVVTIFSNMLDKYLRETDADHIAVIFDASGRSFRNELYDQYKANRREMPDDLAPQCEHVRQAADAFGVCQIEMDEFRGRRSDRDLCAPRGRGRRQGDDPVLRQGHDAAGRATAGS